MTEKGLSSIVIIFVGLLIGAGFFGAYYLGMRQNKTETSSPVVTSSKPSNFPTDLPKQTISPMIINSPKPTIASTSVSQTINWNSYTDGTFRFSLKYPNDWLVEKSPNGEWLKIKSPDLTPETDGRPISGALVDIYMTPQMAPLSIEQVNELTESTDTLIIKDKKLATLNDYPAVYFTGADIMVPNIKGLKLGVGNGLVTFKFLNYGNDPKEQAILDSILVSLNVK